jgi:integrase
MQLVRRWFVDVEKKSEDWYDRELRKLTTPEKEDVLADLRLEEAIYSGSYRGEEGPDDGDGTTELRRILKEHDLVIEPKDPLFAKLAALIRKGRLENVHRNMERLAGDVPTEKDSRVWRMVKQEAQTPAKAESMPLGEMLKRFEDDLSKQKRSEATKRAYQIPIRILKETIGEKRPLESIAREDVEKVRDFLREIPVNAAQRYKGKTLAQAVKAADSKPNVRRLNPRTALNYLTTISTIFNFAVDVCGMEKNPASDHRLKAGFKTKKPKKAVFTAEELNKMFKAPLYTGCVDDENGYAKPGPCKKRRGRFWVPLLALFHGLRSNEACQLYTEDVREVDGVQCLMIRDDVDDGKPTEKRLKTAASERTIPIHAELLKMGFLDYVALRRKDSKDAVLFYELTKGKSGKFSDPFGKWFGRFLKGALGYEPQASMHSFRHMFRDALRRADVGTDKAEALGGWHKERSSEADYGSGFPVSILKAEIDKVEHPSVFLAHLYRK